MRSVLLTPTDITAFKTRLADLKNSAGTSSAMMEYLDECLWRDPIDVLNEIDVLASLLTGQEGSSEPSRRN